MLNVEKNKLYFRKDTGEAIVINGIVDYCGTNEICVNYSKGYGANQTFEKELIPYSECENFANNLESKQTLNKQTHKKVEKQNKMEENKNNFKELRSILFDTLRDVKDGKMDVKKAKSISEISQTLINSAKVEVDYLKSTGNGSKSNMIE